MAGHVMELSKGITVHFNKVIWKNQSNQLSIQSLRRKICPLWGGNRDNYPASSEVCSCTLIFSWHNDLSVTAEAASYAGYAEPFLFTGKKAIFPANTGREKRWQWLPTTLMCHYDFNQFVPHNPGLRLHFSFFLERLGKIGQGRQHVNSLRAGKKKNNLMDCFGTSSQLHRFIHPHPRTQGATALLLLLFFSRQSARTELVHSLSPWLLKQRHRKQFCRILAIYMMSSCLTAPVKNIHTTSSAS